MTTQSQLKNFAVESSEFMFATSTLDKIGKGQGSFADLLTVGITAASFTVLPAKLAVLGAGALMAVIKAASKTITNKTATVAMKNAAARTLDDALTIKRQGYVPTGTEPVERVGKSVPFDAQGKPIDKYDPQTSGLTRTSDEDFDYFDRDTNPAQAVADAIATRGPKRIPNTATKKGVTKEELEAEEKLKEIQSSGMYDKAKYNEDEINNLIAKLTDEEKVLLKGKTKTEVEDYVRGAEYETIPVPGAGKRSANATALRRIHSGNYTDDEILEAFEAARKWNKNKINADAEEVTGLYLSIRRLLKDEKLEKGTVPPDILKYLKTYFPGIKKEFREKVVDTASGKAILKTYEKEHPLQRFVEKDVIGKDGKIVAQEGDIRPTDSFIRYEETVDEFGNTTGDLDKIVENPTVFLSDDILDTTQPVIKGPTRVRKGFPTVRLEDVPEVIFKSTDTEDVRRASALFAEREKLNIFNKTNSIKMRKASQEEIQKLKESSARNNKTIDKLAVEIKDIGTRLTREEKIRVEELAKVIKERQLLVRSLTKNPKGEPYVQMKNRNQKEIPSVGPKGKEQLDEFDENIKRKYELEQRIQTEKDNVLSTYYTKDPSVPHTPDELKAIKDADDQIKILENKLKTFETKTAAKISESPSKLVVKWKDKTDDTVYIGRAGKGETGKFGNPYEVGKPPDNFTVEEAVAKYNKWLRNKIETDPDYAKEIYALKGKSLGCPGSEPASQCHGQAIIRAIRYLDEKPEYLGKTSKTIDSTISALKPIKSFDGKVSEVTVHSGGAEGADTAWAEAADRLKIKTTAHSFEGHESMGSASGFVGKRPALETRSNLTKEQLEIADEFLKKAAKSLGRPFNPKVNYVNLLRRNYYQLKNSEAVVAIGEILPGATKVDGGTGWAVQMGIDKKIPVYVFDQKVKLWAVWNGSKFEKLSGLPPKFKEFAGVGSRKLNDDGLKAIEEYLEQFMKGK